MGRLYVVRNARTEEGIGFRENPGLDEIGRVQADAIVEKLKEDRPSRILTSPQRRALETAAPLARYWSLTPVVEPSLTLMPLPDDESCDREAWLGSFMKGSWRDAPHEQVRWREYCLSSLGQLSGKIVLVTHFIVVNMIAGAATGDDRVTVFQPDNGSITTIDIDGGRMTLVQLGRQAATRLL